MSRHLILITSQGKELPPDPQSVRGALSLVVYDPSGSKSSPSETAIALNSGLAELQRVALQGAIQKEKLQAQRSPAAVGSSDLESTKSYAAPLSPLRAQDIQELSAFFDRADMLTIEEDLLHMLSCLFPEPCWEDELFEFLGELLEPPVA